MTVRQGMDQGRRAIITLTLIWLVYTEGHQIYQSRLPNGDRIPNPCSREETWQGLGHQNPQGGGARNPFGLHFQSHGHTWSRELCELDSDGDGKSNGEELGDPECQWVAGNSPPLTPTLTHPGVCEPLDGATCRERNAWLSCPKQFDCAALSDDDEDRREVTLRFTRVTLPAKETTYACLSFDLPSDDDYHVVAMTPEVDNEAVVHHMILYGCEEEAGTSARPYPGPATCRMTVPQCRSIIAGWTLGSQGQCYGQDYGFRIGQTGFKTAVLQIHWNNPGLQNGLSDTSGMTLHYTSRLRANDAAMVMTGPFRLFIPPGEEEVVQEGRCGSACTAGLPNKVYLAEGFLHMHYLGVSGKTELYRDGARISTVLNQETYRYDDPNFYQFLEPVEVRPGDELRTSCVYNSLGQTASVRFGEATSDEMCLAFLVYYPASRNFSTCVSFMSYDICNIDRKILGNTAGCDVENFVTSPEAQRLGLQLLLGCDVTGRTCTASCLTIVTAARELPCLADGLQEVMEVVLVEALGSTGVQLVSGLHSCDSRFTTASTSTTTTTTATTLRTTPTTTTTVPTSPTTRPSPSPATSTTTQYPLPSSFSLNPTAQPSPSIASSSPSSIPSSSPSSIAHGPPPGPPTPDPFRRADTTAAENEDGAATTGAGSTAVVTRGTVASGTAAARPTVMLPVLTAGVFFITMFVKTYLLILR